MSVKFKCSVSVNPLGTEFFSCYNLILFISLSSLSQSFSQNFDGIHRNDSPRFLRKTPACRWSIRCSIELAPFLCCSKRKRIFVECYWQANAYHHAFAQHVVVIIYHASHVKVVFPDIPAEHRNRVSWRLTEEENERRTQFLLDFRVCVWQCLSLLHPHPHPPSRKDDVMWSSQNAKWTFEEATCEMKKRHQYLDCLSIIWLSCQKSLIYHC